MKAAAETLTLPGVAYTVHVDSSPAPAWIDGHVARRDVLVLSDENVARGHLEPVIRALGSAARIETLVLPAGEAIKTLEGLGCVLDRLVAVGFHRDAVLVALGGGVIGDLGGFAAACYQRGVDWIAIPTTLLAQVDAAIGGKTAVNHPRGKNLIGAFHDPLAVWASPAVLETLPPREYRAGLAEVVKYGLGLDPVFFGWLEGAAARLRERDGKTVTEAVVRSARYKLDIVAADRKERGRRALLNLGHTLGHALETALGHGAWLHGEAVAVGLVAAAELSAARGLLPAGDVARLRALLEALELPVTLPGEADGPTLGEALKLDKKIADGRLRFIGLRTLGNAEIWDDVDQAELDAAITAVRAAPDRAR